MVPRNTCDYEYACAYDQQSQGMSTPPPVMLPGGSTSFCSSSYGSAGQSPSNTSLSLSLPSPQPQQELGQGVLRYCHITNKYLNPDGSEYLIPEEGRLVGDGYLLPMEPAYEVAPVQSASFSHNPYNDGSSTSSSSSNTATPQQHELQCPAIREGVRSPMPELLEQQHRPLVQPVLPLQKPVSYVVQIIFKHGRKASYEFVVTNGEEPQVYKHYVVEGDRGEDIGTLTQVMKEKKKGGAKLPKVTRLATADEVHFWSTVLDEEEQATLPLVRKIVSNMSLPLTITHASYQLDKKKLTFYYESPQAQPDFRCILGECYAYWKTRIWFTCLTRPAAAVPGKVRKTLRC